MLFFKKKTTVNETINKVRTSSNAVLIDCRTKEEFSHGHIAGAVNIPVGKITKERVQNRFPDKEREMYIVGSYTDKPSAAISAFKKLGYKKLRDGGYMEEHYGPLSR